MPEDRLPRRMLTAWVPTARLTGRPQLTYAHAIVKDLKKLGLDRVGWGAIAEDRAKWRGLVKQIRKAPKQKRKVKGKVAQAKNLDVG